MTDAFDWGLLEPLSAAGGSSASDDAVLAALVQVERALVLAWGALDDQDLGGVAASLDASTLDRRVLLEGGRDGGVPVIPLVSALRDQAEAASPGSGAWVHRGATSQDVLDSALVLVSRQILFESRAHLIRAGRRLSGLAEAERGRVIIERTLSQPAEASTLGAHLAGWLDGVSSAVVAIDEGVFPVQLGGAVGTGRAMAEAARSTDAPGRLRAALARELGLADPGRSWHTERSAVLRIAGIAAEAAAALGRIGHDLALGARDGVLLPAHGGGSSAMAHKHNPVDAVLLTANGLRAPGLLATVHSAAVSSDARPAGQWHAEWQAWRTLLRIAAESAGALPHALDDLVVHPPDPPAVVAPWALEAADVVVDRANARFGSLLGGGE